MCDQKEEKLKGVYITAIEEGVKSTDVNAVRIVRRSELLSKHGEKKYIKYSQDECYLIDHWIQEPEGELPQIVKTIEGRFNVLLQDYTFALMYFYDTEEQCRVAFEHFYKIKL
ncbi:MAG: hypothetical protein RSE00_02505 [Clostridia bacterium]